MKAEFNGDGVLELSVEDGVSDPILVVAGEARVPEYAFRTSGADDYGWTVKQDHGDGTLTVARTQRNEHTSPEVLIVAAKVMRGEDVASEDLKRLAASAMTQARDRDNG